MATGARVDPFLNFIFLVEIDGITQAGFTDCLRLSARRPTRSSTRRAATTPRTASCPARTKYPNITLKWGLTDFARAL